ncbi:MAG: DUF5990 family protein [Actinomycetota bacterium]|nr:DUF5990 family protein [Actinomycetota bacterium]
MQIRIVGSTLPGTSCGPSPDRPDGYRNIHVGVQRRNRPGELFGVVAAAADSATWTLDCDAVDTPAGIDLKGPHIQGPAHRRFVYLSWVTVDDAERFTMFRRAKLWLDAVPPEVLDRAVDHGLLVGRLGLTDPKGNPLCASVRPPVITWSAPATS